MIKRAGGRISPILCRRKSITSKARILARRNSDARRRGEDVAESYRGRPAIGRQAVSRDRHCSGRALRILKYFLAAHRYHGL